MTIAILSECALSRKDGTGVQILRMFRGDAPAFCHFYFTHFFGGKSECARSFRLEDPRWPGRGQRPAKMLERWVGLNWWNDGRLDSSKFRSLVRRKKLACDVAYVLATSEHRAAQMNAVLAELGVPYVAHSMDLYHQEGLDPTTMPQLAKLFRSAAHVFAISEPIRQEIQKFGIERIELIPFGRDYTDRVAQPPAPAGPINVMIVGRHYESGLALLADAWLDLKRRYPTLRLVAVGQHNRMIPAALRADLDDRGFMADQAAYEELLTQCHIGYLSGPSEMDHFGRFSIPSRSADFLMAGLPILAAIPRESAAEQFLRPLESQAVRIVSTPQEVVAGLDAYLGSAGDWEAASLTGRQFATEHLDIDRIRQTIFFALKSAAHAKREV